MEIYDKAIEAAARTLAPDIWVIIDKFPDDSGMIAQKVSLIEEAQITIDAYLSALVVADSTELASLPTNAFILDRDKIVRHMGATPEPIHHRLVPAQILYIPQEEN